MLFITDSNINIEDLYGQRNTGEEDSDDFEAGKENNVNKYLVNEAIVNLCR
jgi:hypothetical protein